MVWLYAISRYATQTSAGCLADCSGENLRINIHRYTGVELLRITVVYECFVSQQFIAHIGAKKQSTSERQMDKRPASRFVHDGGPAAAERLPRASVT